MAKLLEGKWKEVLEEMRKNKEKIENVVVDTTTGFIETKNVKDNVEERKEIRRA